MPALAWGSPSQLVQGGGHGASSQTGKQLEDLRETLGGLKQSALSSSFAHSTLCFLASRESLYTATTWGSSKVGGQAAIETRKPTSSSDRFTVFSLKPIASPMFAQNTCAASSTWQMDCQEESFPHHISSFQGFPSPLPSSLSLSTLLTQSLPQRNNSALIQPFAQLSSKICSCTLKMPPLAGKQLSKKRTSSSESPCLVASKCPCFDSPLTASSLTLSRNLTPHPYPPSLIVF